MAIAARDRHHEIFSSGRLPSVLKAIAVISRCWNPRPAAALALTWFTSLMALSGASGCGDRTASPPAAGAAGSSSALAGAGATGAAPAPASSAAPSIADRAAAPPPPPEDRRADLLAAGGAHTCARLVDGTVWCWGANNHGQLGWGEPTFNMPTRTIPTMIRDLGGVEELALGGAHGCARLKDGAVLCWGANVNAQIGDGTTDDRYRPTPVEGLKGAARIAAGQTASCAAMQDGTVMCWGGMPTPREPPPGASVAQSRRPAPVPDLANVTAVTMGAAHACALGRDGAVRCWGENQKGQLGDGTTAPRARPTLVKGLRGAVQIDAGPTSTCALLRDARVSCWGAAGDAAPGLLPKVVPGLSGIADIAGSCGRGTEGAVSCRRADGTEVMEESGAARIAAGRSHACLLTTAGEIRCWGSNGSGQLGDGSKLARTTPVPLRW